MQDLDDTKLRGLVVEETGEAADSNVVTMIVSCIKAIKKYAKPAPPQGEEKPDKLLPVTQPKDENSPPKPDRLPRTLGMNLSYTINLNLPATPDVAVFNAIFKSLKENLLKDSDG